MGIAVKASKLKKIEIYSFLPIDRADCPCQPEILKMKGKLAEMPPNKREQFVKDTKVFVCPKNKTGYNRYELECKNCHQILGYCWASTPELLDWFDFHFTQWTDGKFWYGCFTPHISPITQKLCLECTCGQDTRDFRANMTMPSKLSTMIEDSNKVGRDFGKSDSKFEVRQVLANVLPFN